MQAGDPAQTIAHAAVNDGVPVCVETLNVFVSIYGAEAGNLALKFLATGGVFIGRGIAPKIIDWLKHPAFKTAFCNKGRMHEMLEKVCIKVISNDLTALYGAAHVAWLDKR